MKTPPLHDSTLISGCNKLQTRCGIEPDWISHKLAPRRHDGTRHKVNGDSLTLKIAINQVKERINCEQLLPSVFERL